MANGIWYGSVNDSISRGAVNQARITVTDPETDDLLGLYKDREGTQPLGNPFLTRQDGAIQFFVRAGRISVNAAKGGDEVDFLDEIVVDDWGDVSPWFCEFVEAPNTQKWAVTPAHIQSSEYGYAAGRITGGAAVGSIDHLTDDEFSLYGIRVFPLEGGDSVRVHTDVGLVGSVILILSIEGYECGLSPLGGSGYADLDANGEYVGMWDYWPLMNEDTREHMSNNEYVMYITVVPV